MTHYEPLLVNDLRLVGSKTVTFNAYNISKVTLNTRTEYLYVSEIILNISRTDTIVLNGFTLRDARIIKEIIDQIKLY